LKTQNGCLLLMTRQAGPGEFTRTVKALRITDEDVPGTFSYD
jgi:hypothetical protein